ncbi:MAG: ATP-dependent DNA helicase [Bacteroidota bacterium]
MAGSTLSLQQHNEAFSRVLAELNAAQRKAVEQIEGPVLVIAGPGTGKTHILTARIGKILLETDTQAHNILCLTFTDAGVQAMRERLISFIGPEAHRVHIYTFHSFCNSIIQENLEFFGRHDLEPLSELDRIEIIRKLLDDLPIQHPLKKGRVDSYFYERHLYDLFKKMKAEAWSVELVHEAINSYLASLETRPEFIYKVNRGHIKKGSLKEEKIKAEAQKMERLQVAADLYPAYQRALRKARRYDYDDMILWVLDAFRRNEGMLRRYQEQYLYVLVDEYQDTNGAQNNIITQLIDYWEVPNIFIVGDDDQSIYEFQGARLKNLSDFYQRYIDHTELVVLTENYRSSQHILNAAHHLIQRNEKRIMRDLQEVGIEKFLQAKNARVAALQVRPKIVQYPNRMQEDAAVVTAIEQLYENGADLSEVAIIYAQHKQVATIQELLQRKGIPFQTRRKVNVLDQRIIQNLRVLLRYLQHELQLAYSGEYLLFQLLYFPFFEVAPRDIAKLGFYLRKLPTTQRPHWRDAIADRALLESLALEHAAALLAVSTFLEELMVQQASLSLPAFIERVANKSGLLGYIFEHPERNWLLQVLRTFMDFVKEETDRSPRIKLKRLLDILEKLDSNRISVELNKAIGDTEGVQLLTAHSSKGLEFERVFIIDGVKDYWEPRNRIGSSRFALPDTLTYSNEEDAIEARRRLFFVAMTRAKVGLHLSFSASNLKGKPLQQARFIDELLEQEGISLTTDSLDAEELLPIQHLQLTSVELPTIAPVDSVWVAEALEGFVLSISAMNRYLKCPLSFFYEHVLRVPSFVSESANYGIAIHNALQRLFEKREVDPDRQFLPVDQLVHFFEQELDRISGFFGDQSYQKWLALGRQQLSAYYRHHVPQWVYKTKVEWPFRQVEVDGVPLTGVIDRVDYLDNTTVRLIDYKTGKPKAERLRKPSARKPYGGSYWRQLLYYKILFEEAGNTSELVQSAAISYLEMDAKSTFVEQEFSFNRAQIETMKTWIKKVYEKIQAQQFYEGCGEPSCKWCEAVRQREMPTSFADSAIEALDD